MPGYGSNINPLDMMMLDPSQDGDNGDGQNGGGDPRRNLMRLMMAHMATQGLGPGDASAAPTPAGPSSAPSGPGPGLDSSGMLRRPAPSDTKDLEDAMSSGSIQPPGFDESTGLPTSFPATATKNAARDKLQRLQQPQSGKQMLLKALITAAPIIGAALAGRGNGTGMAGAAGAAQGALASEERQHERHQVDINRAEGEYQYEGKQEEQQREQALKEKLSIQNLEAQKSWKSLTAAIQAKKVDVTQAANVQKDERQAAALGYKRDGQGRMVPIDDNDMSLIQKARVDVENATEEYRRAQMNAIPQNLEIKRKALDLANQRLALSLQNIQFNQDMKREQQDYRETGPTTQLRDRAQQAQVIQKSSSDLIDQIKANKGQLGPWMGRYGSLMDALGAPPPEFAGIASQLITYIALQPAAHGFKGLRAVHEFEKSIGTPIRTPEALIAAIQGNTRGLEPMGGADKWTPLKRAEPGGGPGSGAAAGRGKLKKSTAGGTGNQPPAGAKVRDYTQLGR